MPPKYRLSLAIIAGLAVFGWRQWQEHRAATATETTRDPSAQLQSVSEPKRKLGTLEFSPCALPGPYGKSLEAQCTSVEVAEDPAQPQGRRITLNLAWLPARREAELKPDPVFFLAGGPGQSATESFPQLDPAFAELRKTRHVLLLDQRGTGKSNPLACPPSLIEQDEAGEDLAASVAQADACRDALTSKADLRFYTTTDAVRDLDAVRAAIGAAQVNLVGVSYGTRVAQQYAMRHPAQARSIVLDSVVPNTLVLGNIWGRNLDDALALQFGQCEQDATCREKLGNPRAELDTLLSTLKRQPPLVRFRDARTHEWREQRLTEAHVAGLVRMYAYMPLAASLLPALIHDANAGNYYASLMALSQMLADTLQESMAMGMQLSVVCSEDGDAIARNAADEGTVLGTRLTDAMAAQCQVWPKGEVPADFHQPLASEVPALLLEGEFDPVTPPRYGEEVAQTLPNGRLLVLRGQGHNVIGAGCMPRLFARFIDTADAKALDARCLDDLAYAQPFTSFNGWNP